MWWSFRKSRKVGKGGRVNLSKGGVSASYGGKGARVSISRRVLRPSFKLFGIRFGW